MQGGEKQIGLLLLVCTAAAAAVTAVEVVIDSGHVRTRLHCLSTALKLIAECFDLLV